MGISRRLSQIRAAAGRKGGRARTKRKIAAARRNAKLAGSATSPAKAAAARRNGKLGGRPPLKHIDDAISRFVVKMAKKKNVEALLGPEPFRQLVKKKSSRQ